MRGPSSDKVCVPERGPLFLEGVVFRFPMVKGKEKQTRNGVTWFTEIHTC